jgi:hypothetical protein
LNLNPKRKRTTEKHRGAPQSRQRDPEVHMAVLKSARHELFAQHVAKGEPASVAYLNAGYKPDEANAARLTRIDRIRARIDELQAAGARRAEIDLERLLGDLEEIKTRAIQHKQFGAAVSATREQAALAGLRTEKRETSARFEDAEKISDAELARIAFGEDASCPETP